MTILRFVLPLAVAGLQLDVSASTISPPFYEESGRTWLQLTETRGMSIADFESGMGGLNAQYRLATASEVSDLIDALGIRPTEGTAKPNGNSFGFVAGVGGSTNGYYGTWISYNGDQGAIGRTRDAYVDVGFIDGDSPFHPGSADCPRFYGCTYARISYVEQNITARDIRTGLFLIKNDLHGHVPEPSSLALFGAAGLAAWGRRKRISTGI